MNPLFFFQVQQFVVVLQCRRQPMEGFFAKAVDVFRIICNFFSFLAPRIMVGPSIFYLDQLLVGRLLS